MKREFLKELGLEDETIEKVMAEHGKSVAESSKAKEELETLKSENEALKEQITTRDKDLEELKNSAGANQGLTEKYAELEAKYQKEKEDWESNLAEVQKNSALEIALTQNKAKNIKAAKALLNLDELQFKDGALEGLEEQLKALRESDSYLFESDTPADPEPATPSKPIVKAGNPEPIKPESIDPFLQGLGIGK